LGDMNGSFPGIRVHLRSSVAKNEH
jgi:hypothetical protein